MKEEILIGTINTNTKGFGFFRSPELENDIFISPNDLNQALNGDTVSIKITGSTDEGPFGVVVEILKRAKMKYVGVIDNQSGTTFVILDDKKSYVDFYVPKEETKNSQHGDKVVVELLRWKKDSKNPTGKVVEILGKKGDNDAEMRAIVIESGFEGEFPPEVEREARTIKKERGKITTDDLAEREDLREITTLTIDPETAKDFDDAISIRTKPDNTYEIGVHIADVSHFVDFGSILDKEAYERGFSVYLVDRTIPMLPEILSNDLCSLNPHEDKHAFSAIITLTQEGKVLERRFAKSIIHSDKRFSYESAQAVLNVGSGEFFDELNTLNRLAKKLVNKNREAGSIEFETDEVTFELDNDGRPVKVVRKERLDTHKLVEEFMLLANKEVAKRMSDAVEKDEVGLSLYRVHDVPPVDRIESYTNLVRALGHKLPLTEEGSVTSKNLGIFLATLDGKAEESLLKTAAIRSMSKALYSTTNIGHYGLAFEFYTHFTSPIRRYADLVIHRLLYKVLKNEKITTKEADFYFDMIPHITERESAAVDAERTSVKYKHVEFMLRHVGEFVEGTITGVSEWGIYVEEKESKAEGMVSLRSLEDHFTFDREGYRVIGEKTKKVYRLGDSVSFKVARADVDKKQLDYELF
jgi:ribonuclease R